jgi:hypothetical protein
MEEEWHEHEARETNLIFTQHFHYNNLGSARLICMHLNI